MVRALLGPTPKMYGSAASTRFSRGRSTPAIRAIGRLLPLLLLVFGVLADDVHSPSPLDHLTLLTHPPDRRSDFHAPLSFRYPQCRIPSLCSLIPCSPSR